MSNVYYSGRSSVCPVCGGKIKHPYTGSVSSEQIEEDMNSCIWMEVCDEGDGCLGYTPCCKNIHPYTVKEEDHKFIHYDLIEMLNSSKQPLKEKIDLINKLVSFRLDRNAETGTLVQVQVNDKEEITGINFIDGIKEMTFTLTMDNEGNITLQ